MMQFNELRITPDGKFLIIDVEVQNLDYYDNVWLNSIHLNAFSKSEDFVSPIPDSKSILVWETPDDDQVKHIRKVVDIDSIGDNLFFIYVIADGEPSGDTPCGFKDFILVGVVYNKSLLYNGSIKLLGTMNVCTPSKELIDYILHNKAFELAINVGDYKAAIDYWNILVKKKNVQPNHNCGCHGH